MARGGAAHPGAILPSFCFWLRVFSGDEVKHAGLRFRCVWLGRHGRGCVVRTRQVLKFSVTTCQRQ